MTYAAILAVIAALGTAAAWKYKLFNFGIYSDPAEPINPNPAPMPETPSQTPEMAPQSPVQPVSKLGLFCTAIRDFEGAPGDLNYVNNNPGNCRCSPIGYLPKYGNVLCVETSSGKFAKFPTYALGWEYLEALVMNWATLHPSWTILDFFTHYAPSSDNNPTIAYAENVAAKCGASSSTTLMELLG